MKNIIENFKNLYHKNDPVRRLINILWLKKGRRITQEEVLTLSKSNPRYKFWADLYSSDFNSLSFWSDWLKDSDLANFRGENVFVTQIGRGFLKKKYLNSYLYSLGVDHAEVYSKLDLDDGAFGAIRVKIGKDTIVTRDQIDSVIEINYLIKKIQLNPEEEIKFLDIGSGYGRFASNALKFFPRATVFCADVVPQASFVAEYYLHQIGFLDRVRLGSYDQLKNAGNFDIAINIHSFSESPYESIEKWILIVRKAQVKFLFIVPSGNGLMSYEPDKSRKDYFPLLTSSGYDLIDKRKKYTGNDAFEFISPADYYLFQLRE
jgi:hypothetical protein